MWSVRALSIVVLTSSVATIATPSLATQGWNSQVNVAQNTAQTVAQTVAQRTETSRAERACVDAVTAEGYRVNGILEANRFSGGAEVIMEAERQRGRRERLVIGCDYADNTQAVALYRIERYSGRDNDYRDDYRDDDYRGGDRGYDHCDDDYDYDYDDDDYDYENDRDYDRRYHHSDWQGRYYDSDGIRDDDDAEDIARAVVGDQLGLDPYSEVVRIDEINQESRYCNWRVEGRVNGAPFIVRIRASDGYVLGFELY